MPDLPKEIIGKLEQGIKKAIEDPEVIKRMEALMLDPAFLPAAEMQAKVDKWDPIFAKITEDLGLKIAK